MAADIPQNLLDKFADLAQKDMNDQVNFFLKSFIFALGDDWKNIIQLSKDFSKYLVDYQPGARELDATHAADFLQKNGKTRTALQRKQEIRDVDLDFNDKISFIEFLLLIYKAMILSEYYKRMQIPPEEDLSNDAVGVTGVGAKLLDELFTLPLGLDPALEKAIDEFTAKKREREKKMKTLEEKAAAGGVKGMTAKNELEQMVSQDQTETNRLELTLNAAKRKASKQSGEKALQEKQKAKEDEEKRQREESRNRLAAKAAMFGK
mmetsp:Transcript_13472/g.20819  ORF Transcript_13472/g.20819 Transcript_13472/m.20819 type:complete len:264 (+) Transcript_13472:1079-1870(+)